MVGELVGLIVGASKALSIRNRNKPRKIFTIEVKDEKYVSCSWVKGKTQSIASLHSNANKLGTVF